MQIPEREAVSNMIKIYSTPACLYCLNLKKFLEENNIEFVYIDVSKDREALKEMVEKSGQMGVPVTDIDGEIIVGFDRERISSLLNIEN